jgi:hypothetical protein
MPQEIRARTDKWNYIKIRNFCTIKETVIRIKRQPTERAKIFPSFSSDKELISGIYKEFQQLKNKKISRWANQL